MAVDPHKWFYAPLEEGAVLVRDAEALNDALQNSRFFRALKVWLAIRQVGRSG